MRSIKNTTTCKVSWVGLGLPDFGTSGINRFTDYIINTVLLVPGVERIVSVYI